MSGREQTLRRVLVLGADGFIGRHIAFHLRSVGVEVLACARRPQRLAVMGFETLGVDLTDPACADPAFWAPHLEGVQGVINAAGLLTGTQAAMRAVHVTAPQALYAAMPQGCAATVISAIGIDQTDTRFAQMRRAGEDVAAEAGVTILRVGLVLGDTSYGGSSLLRALAVMPLRLPVVGRGAQRVNPVHAEDLARLVQATLVTPPPPGAHQVGGPETLTLVELLSKLRQWFGLAPREPLHVPPGLVRWLGRLGDGLRFGPMTSTSVAQLHAGIHAPLADALAPHGAGLRGVSEFLTARPAGTQDLWHARLYLLKPMIRVVLAALWLVSGLLGLLLPPESFLPLVPGPETLLVIVARLGGALDLLIAAALLRDWRPGLMVGIQVAVVLGYTAALTGLNPSLWALPLGGVLKNLPILALLAVQWALHEER